MSPLFQVGFGGAFLHHNLRKRDVKKPFRLEFEFHFVVKTVK